MKEEVRALREEFLALLEANTALPEHEQLPSEAFELDPKIRHQMEQEVDVQMSICMYVSACVCVYGSVYIGTYE